MNWLDLVLGLAREAATSETGQEILRDLRGTAAKKKDFAGVQDVEGLKLVLEERQVQVDRNFELIVQMLNSQSDRFLKTNRRQRIWNIALAAGTVLAIALTIYFAV